MRNTIIGLILAVFGLATTLRANDQPSSAVQPETQSQGQQAPEASQAVAPVKEKKKRRAAKKEKKVEQKVEQKVETAPKAEPAKNE